MNLIVNETEFLKIIEKNIKIGDKNLLIKAYNFGKDAHILQKRDSGQPYFVHPLDVAITVSEYNLDENSVIAALLHDTVEDTKTTIQDIEKNFGKEVSYLVDGLTKIENAKFQSTTEKNAENFRKLILTTAKDIRILIIKLIDVLNNMKTISGIKDKERRDRFANRTLMIYIPLAERIGMYNLKLELEDLCFEELFQKERKEILANIKKTKRNQKNIIEDILKQLNIKIKFENGINCRIIGREKKSYSIWKKMQKKSITFEKLFDIIAFRIIVNGIDDCYKVLGYINSNYVMIPDTFKDYISKPKDNGYQSLHLVIIGPKNVKIEIQIRTEEMNHVAEYGIASHWMYKQNIKENKRIKEYNFIQQLVQNVENSNFNPDSFEELKYEIYQDEIFCYTPKGDIINLLLGSTPIDFAYAIHRDIGNNCCGIKINGIFSQFRTELHNGDEVEILTAKTIQVNEEWLNFVKTTKAKNEIRSFIRKSRQDEFESIGRKEIETIEKELGIQVNDDLIKNNISKLSQGIKTVAEIYSLIAQGKINKKEFIKSLFPNIETNQSKDDKIYKKQLSKIKINIKENPVGVQGLDKNVAYKYAKCCYPIPPESIVGVVNNGIGITVHKKNCNTLKNIKDERIIDLEWNQNDNNKYIAKIIITTESISGILAKVVNLCADKKVNIIGLTTLNESEFFQDFQLKIEIKDSRELDNFKAVVRAIKGVIDVQ